VTSMTTPVVRSDFQSLRGYANVGYAKQILVLPVVGVVAGAISGSLGGLLASVIRRSA
jgi:hypothetical protein